MHQGPTGDGALVPLLVLAAAGFAALGVVALWAPQSARRCRPLVPAVAAAAAVFGASAAPAATGIEPLDAVLRAVLCAGTVVLAAHARPWAPPLAAALALAAAGAPGLAAELAATAFGVALGAAAARMEAPFVNAVVAALVTHAAFRLDGSDSPRTTAYAAAAALLILIVAGVAGLSGPGRLRLLKAVGAGLGLAAVAGLLGLLSAALARPAVEDGIRAAATGLEAARNGDSTRSGEHLAEAGADFSAARSHLDAWWARPASAVPGVSRQIRALRAMASSGVALSRTGASAVRSFDSGELKLVGGAVPLDRIEDLRAPARRAFTALALAGARLDRVRSPWLVSPLARRLEALSEGVDRARARVRSAMVALDVAPALLGADAPRRYFLAIQTPAEQRGSGGLIGNFGEIGADGGRLSLDRVGRDSDLNLGGDPASRKLVAPPDYLSRYARFDLDLLWQNITMSPDFPTVARAIASLYPQSGGSPVDGVVSMDPIGLAALLTVIGPVDVPGWPVPITGENAAEVLLFEQYLKLEGAPRVAFLGQVTAAVWDRLTTTTASVADLGRALGPMIAGKHLMLASVHPEEERALLELGLAGAMVPVHGDFLGMVTQNAGGNKIDWYLRRALDYQAGLDPATGQITSKVRVTLRNGAPAKGPPPYVIGNLTTPALPTGSNKTYLSVYSPLYLAGARVDGRDRLMESERERDRNVYSTYVVIPPGGSVLVELDLEGRLDVGDGYRLTIHRQPFLAPDAVTTSVEVPDGWRVHDGGAPRRRSQELELRTDHKILWPLRRSS